MDGLISEGVENRGVGGGAFDVGFYGNYYLKCTVRSKCMPEDKTLWERVFGRSRTTGMVL